MVFFVPGRITMSASSRSLGRRAYFSVTPGCRDRAWKSVKFDMCPSRTTATVTAPWPLTAARRSLTLSSSSTSASVQGTTPTTGMPSLSSIIRSPGSRIFTSPRNLLMIRPLIRARSSGSSSITVP